jgi:hypothetical protein
VTFYVWSQPLLVPLLPSLIEGVSHKKKEVQVAAEQAGNALIDILCPWAIRVVQSMLFAGAMETKWQVGHLSFRERIGPETVAITASARAWDR